MKNIVKLFLVVFVFGELHEGQKTGVWTNWDEQGVELTSKNYSQLN